MKILVAVIAYNEALSLGKTLADLAMNAPNFDVAVIDNGSSDSTRTICKEYGVPCISHCINTGGSMGTVRTYFLYAFRKGYDIVCQFDGDGQHLAKELNTIIQPLQLGNADYVIGSRFILRQGFQSTAVRRIGIRLFSWIIRKLTNLPITDSTSGFRAYDRRVMELFALQNRTELSDVNQLILLSFFAGMRIVEVPVCMKDREAGVSEFRFVNALTFPLKGLVNILGCWLQRFDGKSKSEV